MRWVVLLSALAGMALYASVAPVGGAPATGVLSDANLDGTYRIFVAADSNTADNGPAGPLDRTSWVGWIQRDGLLPKVRVLLNEEVETSEPVVWTNGAVVGWSCVAPASAGKNSGLLWVRSAAWRGADAIIVAAGTNDLEVSRATPQAIVECYRNMQSAARTGNMAFFVATTPPVYPPYADADTWNQAIHDLNALIRSTFDPRIIIDFDSGFTADMFPPIGAGRHVNDEGEKLRARRVAETLTAAQL